MTNSCSSSSFSALAACLLLATLPAAGCSGDKQQNTCGDELRPTVDPLPETAVRLGQFKAEARTTIKADGTRERLTLASLVLVDSSQVERIARSPDQIFSETCFALTGAPFEQCREGFTDPCVRQPLSIDKVEVGGVPGGLTLEKQTEGNYSNQQAPDPLFGEQMVSVKVTGRDDPKYFPSYTQELAAPDSLAIKELGENNPLVEGEPPPAITGRDMRLRWTAGNGDGIEIDLQVDRPGETDKVVCLVQDDGCHTIPASAFDWLGLDMGPEDKFKLIVLRHLSDTKILDGDKAETAAEIKTVERIELSVSRQP